MPEALKIADATSEATMVKAAKFRAIGIKRVNRAIKLISLIGNLSNRSSYAYSEADIRKLVDALRNALDRLESRFAPKPGENEFTF